MFLHYQYVLGILSKDNRRSIKYSVELKEAMKHIDEISEQTFFVCKNNISDINGLNQYNEDVQTSLSKLINQRQTWRNKARRCSNEQQLTDYKNEISSITNQIKIFKKI